MLTAKSEYKIVVTGNLSCCVIWLLQLEIVVVSGMHLGHTVALAFGTYRLSERSQLVCHIKRDGAKESSSGQWPEGCEGSNPSSAI